MCPVTSSWFLIFLGSVMSRPAYTFFISYTDSAVIKFGLKLLTCLCTMKFSNFKPENTARFLISTKLY